MSHIASDAQLVALCLQGQRQAWDVLVERYIQLVGAVSVRAGISDHQADAVSLTALTALRDQMGALRAEPRLGRWLMATALDECRRIAPNSSGGALDETSLATLEKQHLIRLGLTELAERCQDVLRLWCYDPTHPAREEIAWRLNVASEQISLMRARCLRYLQYALNRLDYPWPRVDSVSLETEQEPFARPCTTPLERLVDYAEGDLDEAQRRTLENHLTTGCAHCRAELAWLMELLPIMRADDAAPPSESLLAHARALYRAPEPAPPLHRWEPLAQEHVEARKRHTGRWLWIVGLTALVGLSGLTAWRFWPRSQTGIVASVERGSLAAQGASDAPWVAVPKGQVVGQGYAIRSAQGTVATLTFFDASLMRIERGGEWRLSDLSGSLNQRLGRIVVRQKLGRASYVSASPRRGYALSLRVETDEGALDLAGVATVTCSTAEGTRIEVWQGRATLEVAGKRMALNAGQTALISPQKAITIIGQTP